MLPPITLDSETHAQLSRLAAAAEDAMPELAAYLGAELDRARVIEAGAVPRNVVTIGSIVNFRDDRTHRQRSVTLVLPEDEDIAEGRVSVMTPVGAALIGVAAGYSIVMRTRTGEDRRLTVVSVTPPHGRL